MGITIAIVNARVTAWKMEQSEFSDARDVIDRPIPAILTCTQPVKVWQALQSYL